MWKCGYFREKGIQGDEGVSGGYIWFRAINIRV